MAPTCYAQRLLNPFRGVMNVIEHEGAEAVTIDGRHWDIYVRDTALVEDLADSHKVQTSDIRYGSWSEKQGLKRGAIYPSDDFKVLEHRGAIVYEYLLNHHREIPFPFIDVYELWLLDEQGLPLALLASATDRRHIDLDSRVQWRAGHECTRHFKSAAAAPLNRRDDTLLSACERLDRHVNRRAGPEPAAQWFLRDTDGTGTGLAGINLPERLASRRLSGQRFPPFFVADCPHDDVEQQLIEDYLAWQAPCLLLLQSLDRHARERLERQAAGRALAVERHHRLYPAVVDPESIQAARVEALLRASDPSGDTEEETMATYYVELNVTRTN
jgi:hypothetical protein